MACIAGFDTYIPPHRLRRSVVVASTKWASPALAAAHLVGRNH